MRNARKLKFRHQSLGDQPQVAPEWARHKVEPVGGAAVDSQLHVVGELIGNPDEDAVVTAGARFSWRRVAF